MKLLFLLFARFPLKLLHLLGAMLGLVVFAASKTYRQRLIANARLSKLADVKSLKAHLAVACQAGMMVAELPRLWLGAPVKIIWDNPSALNAQFEAATQNQQSMLFLTPHLGSWEVAGQAIAHACHTHGKTITVMYKPAKKSSLDTLIKASRQHPGMHTVPADLSGVRQTLKAMRSGGAVGLLPDQVPLEGMGLWLPVFGKPAYTMTLAAKLAQSHHSQVVMVWCKRLGFFSRHHYRVYTQALELPLAGDLESITLAINQAVETAIAQLPTQYLWSYARYKHPKTHP